MIVLDTTVLVYATGGEHPLRQPCRDLVAAVADGQVRATTTVEVIQEVAHVRARRRGRSDGVGVARSFTELLAPLLASSRKDLEAGLALFERSERIGTFDAVLVAAATSAGATALVSADRGFAEIPIVPHVFPDEAGVRALIDQAGEGVKAAAL